jgi:hypothetical protein
LEDSPVLDEGIPLSKIIKVHAFQYIYWTAIFFLISLSSVKLLNPNIAKNQLQSNLVQDTLDPYYNTPTVDFGSIQVFPEVFLFGWICFFAMGYFAKYKMLQLQKNGSILHSIAYLFGLTLFISLISISFYYANIGIVMNIYFGFMGFSYITTLITGGIFLFYLGYSIAFDKIVAISPISRLKSL